MVQKQMNNKYKLIVLCGKAGAGKDYLLQSIYNLFPNDLNLIISDTTRPRRSSGEKNGVNYNFLTEEEFQKRTHIEETLFNHWHYGTPVSSLSPDEINIGVFNPSGIVQLLTKPYLDVKIFYINAFDKTRLTRQLDREKNPNVAEICRRFLVDEEDFKDINELNPIEIYNETPFNAVQALQIISTYIHDWDRKN